ncbi:hypothetical protein [Xanthomonas melonis]|uniref:hypothetical protein n=1 Tax=Xanthomonas melonis TaxID=56456 RepID=UPI00142E6DA1|nr:hypothetical protein [Xanthomonas melonis]
MVGTVLLFLEGSEPDSTVDGASVDVWNKLVGPMSILLTLFRSNVCWAKPNHAFFYCQHSFAFFFQTAIATSCIGGPSARSAPPNALDQPAHARARACGKPLLFRCFFIASRIRTAATATRSPQRHEGIEIVHRLSAS